MQQQVLLFIFIFRTSHTSSNLRLWMPASGQTCGSPGNTIHPQLSVPLEKNRCFGGWISWHYTSLWSFSSPDIRVQGQARKIPVKVQFRLLPESSSECGPESKALAIQGHSQRQGERRSESGANPNITEVEQTPELWSLVTCCLHIISFNCLLQASTGKS